MNKLAALLCLTACAADPKPPPLDCADCDGKADGTNPTAHIAGLRVNVPTNAIAAKIFAHRIDRTIAFELQPGVLRGVAGGTYCVWTEIGSRATRADCHVDVPAATNVTYALGTVTFVHGANDLIAGIDVPVANVCPAPAHLATLGGPIPHVPGTFMYSPCTPADDSWQLAAAPAIFFTVAANANSNVDVTDPMGHFPTRLLPSIGRTLPDALGVPLRVWTTDRNTDLASESSAYAVHDRPLVFFDAAHVYYATADGQRIGGTTMGFNSTVQLRRIDLDHAQVTLPDNSVVVQPGYATIELVTDTLGNTYTHNILLANQPTGYGIDVPPALYRVTTDFTDPTDPTQTLESVATLDLR